METKPGYKILHERIDRFLETSAKGEIWASAENNELDELYAIFDDIVRHKLGRNYDSRVCLKFRRMSELDNRVEELKAIVADIKSGKRRKGATI